MMICLALMGSFILTLSVNSHTNWTSRRLSPLAKLRENKENVTTKQNADQEAMLNK